MTHRSRSRSSAPGPIGLSAAAHAAELGESHVLLEAEHHAADTIYKYQKGKYVMAEPSVLPLRSPMSFAAGTREAVLGAWDDRDREVQGEPALRRRRDRASPASRAPSR